MKKVLATLSVLLAIAFFSAHAGEKAPKKLTDLVNRELVKLGENPVIIKAVNAQNAKKTPLEEIKKIDEKWRTTPGVAQFMKGLMDSDCGRLLREMQRSVPYYAEIFVMDNKGANVAMTDKTSDYWQGDEAKFKESFKNGVGAVFIDEVVFDESAQAYLVQASFPVMDEGKAVGAITIGIDLDIFEKNH